MKIGRPNGSIGRQTACAAYSPAAKRRKYLSATRGFRTFCEDHGPVSRWICFGRQRLIFQSRGIVGFRPWQRGLDRGYDISYHAIMSNRMGRGLALILVLPLGCCVQEDLASCLSTGEQTIRLKQLTLGAERQESFNSCLRKWGWPESYCRAMYLNADSIARDCMKGRGYTFSDRDRGGKCHSSTDYGKAECYQPTWYVTAKQYFPLPPAWKKWP